MPNTADVRIGTYAGGTGGMVTLKSLGIPVPRTDFNEFSRIDNMGDGTIQGNGWSESLWHWGFLTAAQYAVLAAFRTDKTTQVYIRDRKRGNVYDDFLANMIWPEQEKWDSNCVLDFTIRFIAMVEQ